MAVTSKYKCFRWQLPWWATAMSDQPDVRCWSTVWASLLAQNWQALDSHALFVHDGWAAPEAPQQTASSSKKVLTSHAQAARHLNSCLHCLAVCYPVSTAILRDGPQACQLNVNLPLRAQDDDQPHTKACLGSPLGVVVRPLVDNWFRPHQPSY